MRHAHAHRGKDCVGGLHSPPPHEGAAENHDDGGGTERNGRHQARGLERNKGNESIAGRRHDGLDGSCRRVQRLHHRKRRCHKHPDVYRTADARQRGKHDGADSAWVRCGVILHRTASPSYAKCPLSLKPLCHHGHPSPVCALMERGRRRPSSHRRRKFPCVCHQIQPRQ